MKKIIAVMGLAGMLVGCESSHRNSGGSYDSDTYDSRSSRSNQWHNSSSSQSAPGPGSGSEGVGASGTSGTGAPGQNGGQSPVGGGANNDGM